MKLLILYTKNRQEIFNKKSALGSYIYFLGTLLNSSGIQVYLNGTNIDDLSSNNSTSGNYTPKSRSIAKYIPKSIKRFIKELKHLKELDSFNEELKNSDTKYDAVLEYYNLGSDVGLKISKHQNIPLYIFYDGPIIDEYRIFNNSNPYFFKKITSRQKESFLHAKKSIAQSNPMKEYIFEKITGQKIDVSIHQNVDYTKFSVLKEDKIFNTDVFNICFIGSFLKWHEVDLLINAFKNILENNVKAELYLIGDGMEKNKMETYVSTFSKEIQSKITFTGFVSEEELLQLKSKMDIGVMSGSNWYGAPLKIFEYGAMKMGVIAPDTPTIKDLFENDEVVFFEWKNQSALNHVLLDFCLNPKKIEENSVVLHNKIMSKYSEKNTRDFYLDFFN